MARLILRRGKTYGIGALLVATAITLLAPIAQAQVSSTTPVGAANPYPGFFDVAVPGRFSLTLYGGGFISDQYGTTQEGAQAEQSLTYVGVVARATGYQLYMGSGFANPLSPNPGSSSGS